MMAIQKEKGEADRHGEHNTVDLKNEDGRLLQTENLFPPVFHDSISTFLSFPMRGPVVIVSCPS